MKTSKFLLLSFLPFLVIINCKDDPYIPPADPEKAILGKWIEIQIGNYPNMEDEPNPGWYCEYRKDSIKLYYFSDSEIYQNKYWIDSLYHEKTTIINGPPLVLDYEYYFFEDKLRFESFMDATYRSAIFKRIH